MLTHIDKPIRIRNLEIKNRIVRTNASSNLGGGEISENLIAYHEARAKGGVGLSIIDVMSVHPSCMSPVYALDPRMEDTYPRMIERLKSHGMRVFQQLWHAGAHYIAMDGGPSWAPSDIPSPMVGIAPIVMTKAMIRELVEAFAEGARKCERWGVDGVEFHAAHGYLSAQFLAPNVNNRTDEYGGSLENRARFITEALTAMRARVSDDFVIGVRVGDDVSDGGIHSDEYVTVLRRLEEAGLIDYVNVSIANYAKMERIVAGMHEGTGYQLQTSTQITRNIRSPTIVVGRFRTLEEADQIVRAGDASMVALTRAHIADPNLVAKTLAGHPERVRPCIGCNQGCIGGIMGPTGRLGCAVNPATGFETTLGDDRLHPVTEPRKVLVIGGGPAGMEAARVAALRGHKVILAEAQPALGGQLRFAAKAPTRYGIFDIAVWQEQEIFRLGVDVRLNTYMDASDVVAEEVDQVILATGSTPRMDGIQVLHPGNPIEGIGRSNVISSHELFSGHDIDDARTAVVVDDCGHIEVLAVTEYLVNRGLKVSYITRNNDFVSKLAVTLTRESAFKRLAQGDVAMLYDMRVLSIDDKGVTAVPNFADPLGNHRVTVPADIVVFVSVNHANRDLFNELQDLHIPVTAVGDARSPRDLQAAIREGYVEASLIS
nr:FAD-dependent oxidoreductase [Sphingomonas sp. CDS-1]